MSQDNQRGSRRLSLVKMEEGATRIYIDVYINDSGDVVLEGQDIGEAPLKHFGDSDYEYWVTVKSQQKDQLLLHLLQQVFGGNATADSALKTWLTLREIPYETHVH